MRIFSTSPPSPFFGCLSLYLRRQASMKIGHKSRAIFDRYNIINEQELLEAGDQLVEYLAQQAQAPRGRAHPAGAAVTRTAPPVRLEFLILSLNPGLRHRCVAPGVWPTTTEVRSHASLKGHTPLTFAGGHMVARAELNNVSQVSHCRDLVQLPVAA